MALVMSSGTYYAGKVVASDLVDKYAPLVKKVAQHLLGRLPQTVMLDDLIQAGMIGLIEASQKFDDSKGASFETYASIRIRGAMLDEVRRYDWAPRSVHRNSRRVTDAIKQVEIRTGRDARDHEIAAEMGVTVEEYNHYIQDTAGTKLFSFDEITGNEDNSFELPDESSPIPEAAVEGGAFQEALAEAIAGLPEREQMVLALYYTEGLNLKEIGVVLNVSESRVSQIHSQAALRLRSRLSEWK
ncbi:RNA polymerase sigma factor FliA [Oceanospirillum linum]|nr:RNA polymerase sigma factor FliA [Oceanospirillum linum]SEF60937.1 RNA polymerase, sigma 28 subunit, SigD/FliA/WhiG [Oleiphilus messinensis]SMP07080.1 RNA polymerase, sigma 28 subunit, SigD/FliA/WhiG [Oceanospirillum linum]